MRPNGKNFVTNVMTYHKVLSNSDCTMLISQIHYTTRTSIEVVFLAIIMKLTN